MSYQYRSGRSQGWRGGRDLDHAAVHRALGGERLLLTTAERREVIRHLKQLSHNQVARLLGVSWRTVQRHRAAIRRETA